MPQAGGQKSWQTNAQKLMSSMGKLLDYSTHPLLERSRGSLALRRLAPSGMGSYAGYGNPWQHDNVATLPPCLAPSIGPLGPYTTLNTLPGLPLPQPIARVNLIPDVIFPRSQHLSTDLHERVPIRRLSCSSVCKRSLPILSPAPHITWIDLCQCNHLQPVMRL